MTSLELYTALTCARKQTDDNDSYNHLPGTISSLPRLKLS